MDFLNLEELEGLAERASVLPKMALDYYAGASERARAAQANAAAWEQYQLLPRVLVDVGTIDMRRKIAGYTASMPVMVAPMAMHGLAHPDRELATARAAAAAGIPMCASTMATASISEIASTRHPCLFYQLYVIRDRQLVTQWVRQAEAVGYKAVMVTVDAPRLGKREADERNRFRLPDGLQLTNLLPLEAKAAAWRSGGTGGQQQRLVQARDTSEGSGLFQLFAKEVDDTLTWDFLPWLRSITRLPIWVKGILAPEDAALALQHGVDGIVVSNHGGRQLDYAPSALQVLPDVVKVVGGRIPVWMDGGVRRGTDILKALALGADGVLLGRPVLYALALGGQAGVERALRLLRNELELAMALVGCTSLGTVGPQLLLPAPWAAGGGSVLRAHL